MAIDRGSPDDHRSACAERAARAFKAHALTAAGIPASRWTPRRRCSAT
ncbi:hypothetical protein I552_8003 [Mycobacterium xenopi 3993]|nr:hypothetical protein I552_8003 [Mycobacterium xenopi 3993]